jgi:hypothetical protein
VTDIRTQQTVKFETGKVYIHIGFDEPFVIDRLVGVEFIGGRLQMNSKWTPWQLEGAGPEHWLRPLARGEAQRRTILLPPPCEE